MRIIEVTDYSPDWERMYYDESLILRSVFGSNLVDIQHIGSTSVPGLKAKPTIDILISVHDLDEVEEVNERLMNFGYTVHGEYGIPGRRFFSKIRYLNSNDWVSDYHVHVFHEDDMYNIERHISLREFLKANPDRSMEYGNLKSQIALKFPNDGSGYTDAKGDYVKKLEEDALHWYRNSRKQHLR